MGDNSGDTNRRCAGDSRLPQWSCVVYNSLPLKYPDRLRNIMHEFRYQSMFALPGTSDVGRPEDQVVTVKRIDTHFVYMWSAFRNSSFPHQPAGVAIGLRCKLFKQTHVRKVYCPPSRYRGRFGAVRFKRGMWIFV